jgi:hypothetical protein
MYTLDHCAGCFEGWVAFQNIDIVNYVDSERTLFRIDLGKYMLCCRVNEYSLLTNSSRVLPIGENREYCMEKQGNLKFPRKPSIIERMRKFGKTDGLYLRAPI